MNSVFDNVLNRLNAMVELAVSDTDKSMINAEISELKDYFTSLTDEADKKAENIGKLYNSDSDGERHNSELTTLACAELEKVGYKSLPKILRNMPNY